MKPRGRLLGVLLLVAIGVLIALGVNWEGQPSSVTTVAGPPPSASASGSATPVVPPRRPTRRYFFAMTESHCEVYSMDGEQTSASESFPCPGDLLPGERIRIVGKTCTRESSDPERREPVVCPDPLTNLEKLDIARDHPPR
jgi:hypothetical protein